MIVMVLVWRKTREYGRQGQTRGQEDKTWHSCDGVECGEDFFLMMMVLIMVWMDVEDLITWSARDPLNICAEHSLRLEHKTIFVVASVCSEHSMHTMHRFLLPPSADGPDKKSSACYYIDVIQASIVKPWALLELCFTGVFFVADGAGNEQRVHFENCKCR